MIALAGRYIKDRADYTVLLGLIGVLIAMVVPAGISLSLVAYVAYHILCYIGLQQLGSFEKSPFWIFLLIVIVPILIMNVLGNSYINELKESIDGMMNMFNMF